MIRTISTSLACIFGYPEAIDRRELASFLKEEGFALPKPKKEELITESGRSVGEIVEEPILTAHKEGEEEIKIIYNNNANLIGIPSSSFVTVVGSDFECTFRNFELIYKYLRNKKLEGEIKIYEATFTGLVESEDLKGRVSEFFNPERISKLAGLLNQTPAPAGFRMRGKSPSKANWFDLLVDTTATENPKLSLLRLIVRYEDYNQYKELPKLIRSVVEAI